jgi:tRNA 2-selenouridine synthase
MKDFTIVSAESALAKRAQYQAIFDVRSPSEYTLDHFPGSTNLPVLSDAQRAKVGTINKTVSAFEAKRIGAAMIARNIADILDSPHFQLKRDGRVLIYCWRGGNRSASLATILARIGFSVEVIEDGYRAYRRAVMTDLNVLANHLNYTVVVGRTGSGKSLILQSLATLGAQVLDLEALARHKGSVLGLAPGDVQPSQKRFESLLWETLSALSLERTVYVESESKKIGQCQVPEALIVKMRGSPCIDVQADVTTRVALLKKEYAYFLAIDSQLPTKLAALTALHGHERIKYWQDLSAARNWDRLVADLLEEHYDPAYDRSIRRNFKRFEEALGVSWNLGYHPDSGEAVNEGIEHCAKAILDAEAARP